MIPAHGHPRRRAQCPRLNTLMVDPRPHARIPSTQCLLHNFLLLRDRSRQVPVAGQCRPGP